MLSTSLRVWSLSIFILVSACLPNADEPDATTVAAEVIQLDLNDVSILLPPPASPEDPVLAITDLAFEDNSVWPDEVFTQFLAIANHDVLGKVAADDVENNQRGSSIDISEFGDKSVWHIASIRIDPGAPGLSDDIAKAFGQTAQIRLVLQPVTDGSVVHDVAAHLIYSYVVGGEARDGCALPVFEPDTVRFQQIVDDVVALKTSLAASEIGDQAIDTDGLLSVHPAADPAMASTVTQRAFHDALKRLLGKHLDPSKLRAMAIMGLPGGGAPEPWIFLAMAPDPSSGSFVPLPNPALAQDTLRFAQMLDARPSAPGNPSVSPAPRSNNLNPITCQFEMQADADDPNVVKPPEAPQGVSTAELFPNGSAEEMRKIVSVIADPTQAHFFNTDCVSCHTETRREMDILGTSTVDAPIDPRILPTDLWNVRNFGWFPTFPERNVFATATRRTAMETEEVVDAINASLRRPR